MHISYGPYDMALKTIPRAISEARRKASFSSTEAHGAIVVPIFIDKLEYSAIYYLFLKFDANHKLYFEPDCIMALL